MPFQEKKLLVMKLRLPEEAFKSLLIKYLSFVTAAQPTSGFWSLESTSNNVTLDIVNRVISSY